MKKLIFKINSSIATLALMVTAASVNTTCAFWVHQPKMPEGAKKFRKF